MSTGDQATRRIRRNQLVLFSGLAAAVLVVFAAWLGQSGDKRPAPRSGIDAELADESTAEASWVRRSEVRIGGIERRLRDMETRNSNLERENERLQTQLRENASDARAVIDRQAALIGDLGRRLDAGQEPAVPGAPGGAVSGDYFSPAGTGRSPSAARSGSRDAMLPAPPMMLEFELHGDESSGEQSAARPLGAYLPAGSHAEAIVLSGVDASAGVRSQGDPRPVLLRLTGPAHSAAEDGAALTIAIEGCTVTGAAYGDLSSEKVYVRLRTLTCAGDAPETVIETEVAGFVAGTGKAGVRGPVVSREGALVEKAFLAGHSVAGRDGSHGGVHRRRLARRARGEKEWLN